jgi:hypothetical protein
VCAGFLSTYICEFVRRDGSIDKVSRKDAMGEIAPEHLGGRRGIHTLQTGKRLLWALQVRDEKGRRNRELFAWGNSSE